MSKSPEGHPAHGAGDSATHSLGWAAGKPLENPSLVSKAPDHTWPLQPVEYIECSNCCDTGLNQPSSDTAGHLPWWLHVRVPAYQAALTRHWYPIHPVSCAQRDLPQPLIPSNGSNLSNMGASGQPLCRKTPGRFAVPQEPMCHFANELLSLWVKYTKGAPLLPSLPH